MKNKSHNQMLPRRVKKTGNSTTSVSLFQIMSNLVIANFCGSKEMQDFFANGNLPIQETIPHQTTPPQVQQFSEHSIQWK